MRGVLADRETAAALDAQVLVDPRLGDVVEVEVLPVGHVRHRPALEIGQGGVALLVHPQLQPRDHLGHHAKTVGHRRGADLDVAGPQGDEFGGVAPGGDAADAGDRQAGGLRVAGDLGHHVERDRLDRRAAIAAVRALAVDLGLGREIVEVDRGDRGQGVDQRDRIRAPGLGGAGGEADVGDVGGQLHDHRHPGVALAPARHHLDVFRHLAHRRAHAALGHAVRAAEIELDAVGAGVLDPGQDAGPGILLAGHHQRDHDGAVGPGALDRLDLVEVGLQRAVGDQFDVVEPQQAAVGAVDHAVARAVDVDDVGIEAEGLPDHPAPAGFERAHHVVFLVGRRRRGEPERVGRLDADEVVADVGHGLAPSFSFPALPRT